MNEIKNQDIHPSNARDNTELSKMQPSEIYKVYEKGSMKYTAKFRRALWKAHDKKCAYCGDELESYTDIHIDHFIPKAKEVNESVSNLICSCSRCNSVKRHFDIDHFKFSLAVSRSVLGGIVQPNAVKKILDVGVDLPITVEPFYFEKLLGVTA